MWITHLCAELRERLLQLITRDDPHAAIVGWLTSHRQATVLVRHTARARPRQRAQVPVATRVQGGYPRHNGCTERLHVMETQVSTAGSGAVGEAAPTPTDSPDVLPAGSKCGPWVIGREIGRGGMGAVYAVVHEDIGKRAALKIVHRRLLTPAFNIDRVMLEAKVVNAVGHPNIVDIFETGKLEDGRPYVVMERLEGQPLSYAADAGKILPDQVIAILLQVCDAMIAAHAAHIVHRDLKLDNIFLVDNADDPRTPKVKLLDWGIAKVINHDVRHTIEGQLVGTPQYLSPEQARGAEVTPQTDVYSLGVMAYELFLEQLPFEAETSAEIMAMHLRAIPPAPSELWPDVPQQLEDLLLLMLAKNPENRPTMLEVARRLESVGAEFAERREAQLAIATGAVSLEAAVSPSGPVFRRPSTGGSRVRHGSDGLRPRAPSHGLSTSESRRRAPSAGLAPTQPADSIAWEPKRTKRWQFALGAMALVASAMMLLISRDGDTQVADAAAIPQAQQAQVADLHVPTPVEPLAAAMAGATNVAAAAMPGAAEPTTTRPTHRSPSATQRASTRKAPAMPRRAAARIDPDGTIDPYR